MKTAPEWRCFFNVSICRADLTIFVFLKEVRKTGLSGGHNLLHPAIKDPCDILPH
ncbi:MAG: hypothetical protein ACJAYR_002978 [Sneathiella sp.]|jgi:hypothetical protein